VEKESRQSGFLMPSAGRSSTKGNILGEAYYWAINRMMDATVGAEYFSLRAGRNAESFASVPAKHPMST